jgi:hypothetical protein
MATDQSIWLRFYSQQLGYRIRVPLEASQDWDPARGGCRESNGLHTERASIHYAPGLSPWYQTDASVSYLPLHIFMPSRLGATAALPFPSLYKPNFNSLANLYIFFTKIRNFIFHYKIFRNYNLEYSCTFTTKML